MTFSGIKQRKQRWLAYAPSRTDNVLYGTGWGLIALGAAALFLHRFRPGLAAKLRWPFPCAFYRVLHIPCLGCGATRALRAFLQGDLMTSFSYHPAVPAACLSALLFMISQTAGRLSRGKIRMLTFNDGMIYALLFIILLQWIVKLIIGWTP